MMNRRFEVTPREIIASVSIVAIMILFGMFIANRISDREIEKIEKYNKAVKITSKDMFAYGMETNVGNALAYGDLVAKDTVSYDELKDDYMYVKRVKERYTMHTRTVSQTINGKTTVRTETYWTWDEVDSHSKKSKRLTFLDLEFDSSKFKIPSAKHIRTVNKSSNVRYVFYGTKARLKGTVFTSLKDNTISDKSTFHNNRNIQETMSDIESGSFIPVFWIVWVILIIGIVAGFYYLDNKWLE